MVDKIKATLCIVASLFLLYFNLILLVKPVDLSHVVLPGLS